MSHIPMCWSKYKLAALQFIKYKYIQSVLAKG